MFASVFRSAVAVAAPRPLALRSAVAPLALRAYSTPATPPPTSESASASTSQTGASGSGRPLIDLSGARKRFSPNEDPDAWWRAESAARRFGVPGNQYTGRSFKVVGGFQRTFSRMQATLSQSGVSMNHTLPSLCLSMSRERDAEAGAAWTRPWPSVGCRLPHDGSRRSTRGKEPLALAEEEQAWL